MTALPGWLTVPVAHPPDPAALRHPEAGRICALIEAADAPCAREASRRDPSASILAGWGRRECWEWIELGPLSTAVFPVKRLEPHQLDVALSRGRQAAERLKLDGCQGLVLFCWGEEGGALAAEGCCHYPAPTVYRYLQKLGDPKTAALTGAVIASAQMGLWIYPASQGARFAARLASGLNPGVRLWLAAAEDQRFRDPWPMDRAPGCQDSANHSAARPGEASWQGLEQC